MSRVGSRILNLRIAKGMTQKQLAKTLGVSEKFIIEVESGKRVLNDELLKRVLKILEQDAGELDEYAEVNEPEVVKAAETIKKVAPKEVKDIWNSAFELVLKAVPIYDYSLEKSPGTRQLPVISNRIEGFPKEKVAFIEIQDDDMAGFRMIKGDIAFAHITNEFENNAICLVEYSGQRAVRQIKKIDDNKLLLISNKGSIKTEAVSVKSIKILARLVRLEIKL